MKPFEIVPIPPPSAESIATLQFFKDLQDKLFAQLAIPAEFFEQEPYSYARELRRQERAIAKYLYGAAASTPPFNVG